MKQKKLTTQENCHRCRGEGSLSNWDYSFGGCHWDEKPKKVTCPNCGGSGKVTVNITFTDYTDGGPKEQEQMIEGMLKKLREM